MQAPFAYEIYTQLKESNQKLILNPDIENARKAYLNNHDIVRGLDMGAGSRVESVSTGRRISSIARYGISSPKDCTFLQSLIKHCDATIGIELGTALGISTAYLAKSTYFNKIYSFEGDKEQVELARNLLTSLNCANWEVVEGNIDDQLPRKLQMLESIGFALIDANHTSEALLRYFDLLVNSMSPNGIMLIDDIRWSRDMYRGWKQLVSRHEVALSLEYAQKGILLFKQGISKQHYVVY